MIRSCSIASLPAQREERRCTDTRRKPIRLGKALDQVTKSGVGTRVHLSPPKWPSNLRHHKIADLKKAKTRPGNTVLPGGVLTSGAFGARGPMPEGPALRMPPRGVAEPEDIGATVLFFTLPSAGRVTNQALAVEAGWSLT